MPRFRSGRIPQAAFSHLLNVAVLHQHDNMTTRTERFQRKPRDVQDTRDDVVEEEEAVIRFSPEEEAVSAPNFESAIRC